MRVSANTGKGRHQWHNCSSDSAAATDVDADVVTFVGVRADSVSTDESSETCSAVVVTSIALLVEGVQASEQAVQRKQVDRNCVLDVVQEGRRRLDQR